MSSSIGQLSAGGNWEKQWYSDWLQEKASHSSEDMQSWLAHLAFAQLSWAQGAAAAFQVKENLPDS